MTTRRLLIAADVDRSLIDRVLADPRFEVEIKPVRSEDELAAIVGDCQILVTRAYNRVTRRVLDRAPRLELIAQGTSGTDNIDDACVRERGIRIISLPGENANAVAELVIGFMIAMTRTVPRYTREVVTGVWQRDDCATRHELAHYTLGLAGLGQVGMRVARLARAFSMRVIALDPYLGDEDFVARQAERARSLDELLGMVDILSLHAPLTSETRRMIADPQLRALRVGSYLINASRGEVLDQTAALAALANGHLAGVALDVFDPEPPTGGFPDDPRLVLTPHAGGCTYESKASIGVKLYERICDWLG